MIETYDELIREIQRTTWDEAVEESYLCGCLDSFARDEMILRNPYL